MTNFQFLASRGRPARPPGSAGLVLAVTVAAIVRKNVRTA